VHRIQWDAVYCPIAAIPALPEVVMSWTDKLQRQMFFDDSVRKELNTIDEIKRITELADATRLKREMAAACWPSSNVVIDQVRDSVLGSSIDFYRNYEAKHLSLLDSQAQQEINRIWEQHQQRFAVPESVQLRQLATDAFAKSAFHPSVTDTIAAMGRMQAPWLDAHNPLRSVGSFASIHEIGLGVARTPFQPEFTSTLRTQLGDWREVNEIPPAILEDPAVRTEFYLERGFRAELVDFPPDALEEIIVNAGLAALDDEENLVWRDRVSPYVGRIESALRRYVNAVMTEAFGEEWTKRIHPDIVKRWREVKQKRIAEGRPELPHLIYYSEFSDLQQIMQPRDHFVYFKPKFERVEYMQETFRRVLPARNAVAHVGIVTPIDYFTVMTEFARLRHVIDWDE
jgi:hypothetical protein